MSRHSARGARLPDRARAVRPGRPGATLAWTLGSAVAFALAGVLFATSAVTADGTDLRATGRTNLPDLIRDREVTVTALERNVNLARGRLTDLSAGQGSAEVDAATASADALAWQAGVTEVVGPALSVRLDDADQVPAADQLAEGLTLDDYIVHQQDLEGVINALWQGGAEAMMIMDQRVIGTSAVRCVGNVLSLQGRTYSPPYTISAIGDVDGMQLGLEQSESVAIFQQYADGLGLGFDVTVADTDMTFPAYDGTLSLRFALTASSP